MITSGADSIYSRIPGKRNPETASKTPEGWATPHEVSHKSAALYLKFPDTKGAPRVALRGFERIHLDPGASQKIHFDLKPRDLGMVTEEGYPIIAEGDYAIIVGGGQPDTGSPGATGHIDIDGQYALPE